MKTSRCYLKVVSRVTMKASGYFKLPKPYTWTGAIICIYIYVTCALDCYRTVRCFETVSNALKMARDVGIHHGIKDWVLHYQRKKDSSWEYFWRSYMKDRTNLGYFTSRNQFSKDFLNGSEWWYKRNAGSTLHLYVDSSLKSLSHMLNMEMSDDFHSSHDKHEHGTFISNAWLIQMTDDADEMTITNFVKGLEIVYDTILFCFTYSENSYFKIYDTYKIHSESNVTLKLFGTWNQKLTVTNSSIWSRRSSLELFDLKLDSIISPPLVTYIEDQCKSKGCLKGAFPDIWHALSEAMNFTYTVRKANDYGGNVNGSWSGVIGEVQKRETHIAVVDFTITKERSAVVDFLPSLTQSDEGLYLAHPYDGVSFSSYVGSFTQISWISIMLWSIFVALVLTGMEWFGRDEKGANDFQWLHGTQFVFQSLIMLGHMSLPDRISNKIAFVSVVIGGMTIYTLWDAELMSFLASRKTILPFENIEELIKTSKYKLVLSKNAGVYLDRFRHSDDPHRTTLWQRDVEPRLDDMPLYHNMPKYIVDNPFVVAYGDSLWMYSPQYSNCEIVTTSVPIYSARLGWAIQKRSPYYGTFQYHIKKMKESGAVDRSIIKYKAYGNNCPDYSGKPISIQQCFVALSIITAGFVCCLLCWIFECCLFNKWIKVPLPTKKIFLTKIFGNVKRRLFGELTRHCSENMAANKIRQLDDDSNDGKHETLQKSVASKNIEKYVRMQIDNAIKLSISKQMDMRMNNEENA